MNVVAVITVDVSCLFGAERWNNSLVMRMPMAVMGMPKGRKTHNVDQKTKDTNDEKLIKSVQLHAFP